MHDPKTWHCGHCAFNLDLCSPGGYAYVYTLEIIRTHRLEHLIVMLDGATDDDLMEMCGDEPNLPDTLYGIVGSSDPVRGDDVTPVLTGIEALLKADLSRARKEQHQ